MGQAGNYRPNATYTILTADDGVNGSFDEVTSNFAFLNPTLNYDANNVYLQLTRNDLAFCLASMSANQCSTGKGAESTRFGNPIYDAIVGLSADEAAAALGQLSGEFLSSIKRSAERRLVQRGLRTYKIR